MNNRRAFYYAKNQTKKENKHMNERKLKTIFSMKLAGVLMQNGFVLVDMRPNTNGSGKNVFYFNDSPELEKMINQFKNR